MTIMDIRDRARTDTLDYQQLLSILRDYKKPRDRIGALLASGDLIRLRKGLYVFGERYRRGPVSRELLANLIYGPSCVSLDYALSRYGMIPERVENVTSVTTGENRRFSTTFGVFTYRSLPANRYAPGVRQAGEDGGRYLIASLEKALADKVWTDKRFSPAKLKDFDSYLHKDLRMDEERLYALDRNMLNAIARAYASRKIDMLACFLTKRMKGAS